MPGDDGKVSCPLGWGLFCLRRPRPVVGVPIRGGGGLRTSSVELVAAGGRPAPPERRRLRAPVALLGFVVLLGVWELAVRAARVPSFVVPPPSTVVRELVSEPRLFASATLATLSEALGGLVLAGAAALAFAVAALHSRFLDRVLTPLVVVSQTIPVITLAPLLVLWFGYGALPRVVVCALVAFFPMAVTALQGFRSTDPDLLLLLRSVDASRWDVFWRVRLPHAGPFLAAGIRTGVTLSLVGAVVAEWTGAGQGPWLHRPQRELPPGDRPGVRGRGRSSVCSAWRPTAA